MFDVGDIFGSIRLAADDEKVRMGLCIVPEKPTLNLLLLLLDVAGGVGVPMFSSSSSPAGFCAFCITEAPPPDEKLARFCRVCGGASALDASTCCGGAAGFLPNRDIIAEGVDDTPAGPRAPGERPTPRTVSALLLILLLVDSSDDDGVCSPSSNIVSKFGQLRDVASPASPLSSTA